MDTFLWAPQRMRALRTILPVLMEKLAPVAVECPWVVLAEAAFPLRSLGGGVWLFVQQLTFYCGLTLDHKTALPFRHPDSS